MQPISLQNPKDRVTGTHTNEALPEFERREPLKK